MNVTRLLQRDTTVREREDDTAEHLPPTAAATIEVPTTYPVALGAADMQAKDVTSAINDGTPIFL